MAGRGSPFSAFLVEAGPLTRDARTVGWEAPVFLFSKVIVLVTMTGGPERCNTHVLGLYVSWAFRVLGFACPGLCMSPGLCVLGVCVSPPTPLLR